MAISVQAPSPLRLCHPVRSNKDETDIPEHQYRVFFVLWHVSGLGNENCLGQTIEFLHSIKLIHTDLKRENVPLASWDERELKLDSSDVIRVPAAPHIKGNKNR